MVLICGSNRKKASIHSADFVSITGTPIATSTQGSVSTILNRSGIVNDGKYTSIDFCKAIIQVQRTASPLLIPNTAHYKGDFAEDGAAWVASALLVPVLLQGVVYGVFRIYSSKKKAFTQDHIAYATIIAADVV